MAKGHVTITALLTTLVTALLATNNPVLGPAAAAAQTIVDRWASVPAPPPPVLKPVTADPKTTALLMLDLMTQNCGKRFSLRRQPTGHEEAPGGRARSEGAGDL